MIFFRFLDVIGALCSLFMAWEVASGESLDIVTRAVIAIFLVGYAIRCGREVSEGAK
jgi:hypothetical protein